MTKFYVYAGGYERISLAGYLEESQQDVVAPAVQRVLQSQDFEL